LLGYNYKDFDIIGDSAAKIRMPFLGIDYKEFYIIGDAAGGFGSMLETKWLCEGSKEGLQGIILYLAYNSL
jgi:hypothetical protein